MDERYHRVSPSIWLEPWDDDMKLVAFYVLTCEHRTTEGIFRLPRDYGIADMKWPAKRFNTAFDQLTNAGFIEYDEQAQVCLIVKALKRQGPQNTNQVKAAMKAIRKLPPTPLLSRFLVLARSYCERLVDPLAELLDEVTPEQFREAFPEGLGEGLPKGFGKGLGKGSGQGIGDPPSPPPTPSPKTPPTPPQAGGPIELPPDRPTSKRQRDRTHYDQAMAAFAAQHFPDQESGLIRSAIGILRNRRVTPTPDAIRDYLQRRGLPEEVAA